MLSAVLGEDPDVIKVNKLKPTEHVTEYVVHQCLEDGRGVGQPERHDQLFKMPHTHFVCCFPLVPLQDADEVINILHIHYAIVNMPL